MRYKFSELGRILGIILDEKLHSAAERVFGRPLGEVLDYVALAGASFDRLADEARVLMDVLD